ncbi:MAG: TetR/AcrR family transcriptional regulator [Sedimenticola sp.]
MARPIQFEREDVLEKAMQAFWDQGYCATSMANLVEVTNLKPGSLYAAFDSKEGLFLAALDHYGERSVARIERALASADSPLEGIRGYFGKLAEETADPKAKRSCLLVNTALELGRSNPAVLERVKHHLGAIEERFKQALSSAREQGELGAGKDPDALAALLMSSIWGLRVLGGTAPQPQRARAVVDQLMTLLD